MTSFQTATESRTGPIGARQTRVEDAALLRGQGCYADDAAIPPGTLHAAIIRSPHAHARITSVDFSNALLMKGVHGVLVGEDVKRWALPFPVGVRQPMEHWCVAVDKVRYVGEPVAVVIADSRYLAKDAIEGGRITALRYDQIDDCGAYLRAPEPATFYRMHGNLTGGYAIRNLQVRNRVVLKCSNSRPSVIPFSLEIKKVDLHESRRPSRTRFPVRLAQSGFDRHSERPGAHHPG